MERFCSALWYGCTVADEMRLTPENRQRELRGVLEASALPGGVGGKRRTLTIITLDQEDTLLEAGCKIHVRPAWKWLD